MTYVQYGSRNPGVPTTFRGQPRAGSLSGRSRSRPGPPDGLDSVNHHLQARPAPTQHQPARWRAVLAVPMAPQTSQRGRELPDRPSRASLAVPPAAKHIGRDHRDVLRRRPSGRRRIACGVAQLQQEHRHHRQQRDHRLDRRLGRELQLLHATSCLHPLMQLLDDRPMPVPVDHHARLREVARRWVAQEDPLQRLSPLGRLDLAHDHHVQRQRFGAVITPRLLRGHQLDRPGGDPHLGPPRRLPVACRDRHRSAPQRLPVTCVPVQLAAARGAVAQHRAEAVVLGPHDIVTR